MLLLPALSALVPAAAGAADPARKPDAESVFLDLSKVSLGTVKTEEDKKKYLYTIQLEKARITRKTLQTVYENAHELYESGDYEGTRELTAKILNIDPAYEDAVVLQRAALALQGTKKPYLSENQFAERKFNEAMGFYRQKRLAEASARMEETVKLSPGNLKARYWLKKINGELADEHFSRGEEAYRQHRLRETLDQWYSALVLDPSYPRLANNIAKVEAELRQSDANDKLQAALQSYSQGKNEEALKELEEALQVEPGDPKAQRLVGEIRGEMANQYVAEGRRLYGLRQYDGAIEQWKKAMDYGYSAAMAEQLIARAKEAARRETDARRRAEERRREAEEKKKADEEAAAKKAQEEKQQAQSAPLTAPAAAAAAAVTDESRRNAVQHWNSGIIFFQKGDMEKARDEWQLCKQLDPTNSDCLAGLQRIDQQLGAGQ